MLVPGSVDILDTCHASLPPYKCWEGAALLLKHFPVRVHHLHVMGLPSDCSASAAVGKYSRVCQSLAKFCHYIAL